MPATEAQRKANLILRTLGTPSVKFYVLVTLAALGLLWWLQAWAFQLGNGMIVTGLADWGTSGGVPWGMYIGSFIWWVGIAHGGIIISAAVRLFKLEVFKPVTRLAELLTISALSMAGLYIILHLGRPDRMVTSIIPHFLERVHFSPLIWDVTVITMYFVLSGTYILLSLREDIYHLLNRLPKIFAPVYRMLLFAYDPGESKKVERMLWWLAFAVIIMAPLLLHGGVIPWLFQLLPSMPGWNSAIQGPQFLSIALTSAIGSVITLAFIFRKIYGWKEIIPDKTFHRLGALLALFAMFFLWLQLQQIITGSFAPTLGMGRATDAKVNNLPYWVAIGSVAASMIYLGAQTIYPAIFSIGRTVAAGLLAVMAVLLEKALFVIEGLAFPAFNLYEGVPGHYSPSWVELSSMLGVFSMMALFFALVAKMIPVIEVTEEGEEH
ncbi:MAG: polysulfide reductase NrfD [Chloroflexi bacterium]|nr:polysulfide reductase NrfD [Chloroflexota bacterium]